MSQGDRFTSIVSQIRWLYEVSIQKRFSSVVEMGAAYEEITVVTMP
jgi:hypothetical protein